ncbi:MAG: alpha/beta fold hydrolase [Chloroflexi bacterium]|nr:alpha/beta fold hydrolase [Chloroflexota bacterium]
MELALVVLAIAAIALVIVGVAYGIHLSNLIHAGSLSTDHRTPPFDIIAHSAGDGRITLRAVDTQRSVIDLHHDGIFGIVSAGGYGQTGRILQRGIGYAVREYIPLTATIGADEPARLDLYAYPENPLTAHGIAYEQVRYNTELGECRAWFVPGSGSTWIVFAHGRGAHPNESLRIMPTLAESGIPILAIEYRNDEQAPDSADMQHWLGMAEWRDLDSAMQYALDNGADNFVLYGYSMGGGMCVNLLCKSPLADKVRGTVMDSPLLDFGATLDIVGDSRGYPRLIVKWGKTIAALRFGIDWRRMNYLARASELRAPVLILHGEADAQVPAPISRRLADARQDIVRYVGFPTAGHARAWNHDNMRYEAEVRRFLRAILADNG